MSQRNNYIGHQSLGGLQSLQLHGAIYDISNIEHCDWELIMIGGFIVRHIELLPLQFGKPRPLLGESFVPG